MDFIQIVLVVLAVAGIWAVIELALVLRRTRGVVDTLDKTVAEVADTIEEARPVVAKLDGIVDELQPAAAQLEPLLKQTTVAVEALSADLVEVNGVLRDVSTVSGTASAASNAVSGLADAASEKVQRLFGRARKAGESAACALNRSSDADASADPAALSPAAELDVDAAACDEQPVATEQYFTYGDAEETDHDR